MLSVVFAVRVGYIHEDIMTLVQVGLCNTNANGQCDTFVGLGMRDLSPAGCIAALLMDYIASRRGQSHNASRKGT